MPETNAKTELLATVKNEVTGKLMLNVDALPKDIKKDVVELGTQINTTVQDLGRSALKLAELFTKAQELLEGKGYFVAFINSIPGFSQNTVYRMIRRYKMAKEHAFAKSPHVLALAMATGTDIAGENEEKPFGKFSDAVKKVGPPPEIKGKTITKEDRVAAEMWLNEVTATQQKDWHKATRGAKSDDELITSAVNGVMKAYNNVEATKQVQFIKTAFGIVLFKLGIPGMTINPKAAPKTIEDKLVEKKEAKEEGEGEGEGKKKKANGKEK